MPDFPPRYDPTKEQELYRQWERSGAFAPDGGPRPATPPPQPSGDGVRRPPAGGADPTPEVPPAERPTFSIVLPPPNVTGSLHVGHAVVVAVEDLMVRYHRMKGDCTLWIPGVDHAAIATQNVVEKKIRKEKDLTRHQIGREAFLKEVKAFVATTKDRILTQIRSLGASLDWSRLAYTLDEDRSLAVRTIFKRLYDAGILYRGNRIVNWCPRCQSTLADDEVEYREERTPFYSFKYGPVVIGTARPETKFLDKVIVVHPDDPRYQNLIGTTITVDWIDGPVEAGVIADPVVDPEFGTGAMTITPAHSFEDFELAQKHGLDAPLIINEYGKLTEAAGEFAGQKARDARPAIVERLREKGLVEKVDEEYVHNLSVCYRCGTPIEPLPKLQWFVAVSKPFRDGKSLKDLMLESVDLGESETETAVIASEAKQSHAVRNGSPMSDSIRLEDDPSGQIATAQGPRNDKHKIQILPKRYVGVYRHWINHLRDWCVSRQIWFGHRLPVWYCRSATDQSGNPQSPNSNFQKTSNFEGATSKLDVGSSLGVGSWELEVATACPPIVSIETPKKCPSCGGTELEQDPDTLDTWFSSGTWTFSTLGWPKQTEELKTFHPTSVLETGYDILFFWVARMILMSQFALGEVPFRTVYLHGLVRDKDRQKMSKSRGNVVDPLGIVEEYGADALRMALLFGTGLGGDVIISEEKVRGMRNFGTKLWNIGRFVVTNFDQAVIASAAKQSHDLSETEPGIAAVATLPRNDIQPQTDADAAILRQLNDTVTSVTDMLERYQFHLAAETLYDFVWNHFAAVYVEAAKGQLGDRAGNTPGVSLPDSTPGVSENAKLATNTRGVLLHVLKTSVTLLHPFMPFVTEAIWQQLPKAREDSELLITQPWPKQSS